MNILKENYVEGCSNTLLFTAVAPAFSEDFESREADSLQMFWCRSIQRLLVNAPVLHKPEEQLGSLDPGLQRNLCSYNSLLERL